ncbi:MAG: hypothetical protein JW827_12400 [Spirochaetes bacterium]|nr:hypothetical protein [Spirochaetota bacterium]
MGNSTILFVLILCQLWIPYLRADISGPEQPEEWSQYQESLSSDPETTEDEESRIIFYDLGIRYEYLYESYQTGTEYALSAGIVILPNDLVSIGAEYALSAFPVYNSENSYQYNIIRNNVSIFTFLDFDTFGVDFLGDLGTGEKEYASFFGAGTLHFDTGKYRISPGLSYFKEEYITSSTNESEKEVIADSSLYIKFLIRHSESFHWYLGYSLVDSRDSTGHRIEGGLKWIKIPTFQISYSLYYIPRSIRSHNLSPCISFELNEYIDLSFLFNLNLYRETDTQTFFTGGSGKKLSQSTTETIQTSFNWSLATGIDINF